MKNPTVKELIKILSKMNPNAIVCYLEMENDMPVYSSFEICNEYPNVTYINDDGDYVNGDVVAIY